MTDKLKLELNLSNKRFTIICATNQVKKFEEASNYLNKKLSEISQTNKTLDFEKILTMVALNITHDLLQEKQNNQITNQKIEELNQKLDGLLHQIDEANI